MILKMVIVLLLTFSISNGLISSAGADNEIIAWIQSQSAEVNTAQNSIKSFLHSKRIPGF
jgi:hypothetical protein